MPEKAEKVTIICCGPWQGARHALRGTRDHGDSAEVNRHAPKKERMAGKRTWKMEWE